MLSEISQSQKDKQYVIPLICNSESSQIHRQSRMVVARSCEEGKEGVPVYWILNWSWKIEEPWRQMVPWLYGSVAGLNAAELST